jgi:methionine-S-sulfoxide reductase
VVRTRVGYTGGRKPSPTYHDLGDHTETLQIDYDPTRLSFAQVLDLFWQGHNPTAQSWHRQYMSALFYHTEEQKQLALQTRDREAAKWGRPITTEILPAAEFYRAEDYHQKYLLQHRFELMKEFAAMYPDMRDFTDSTAAARVNGYLGGNGSRETLEQEIEGFGLSSAGREALLRVCPSNAVPLSCGG